jgi:hypothetical protein
VNSIVLIDVVAETVTAVGAPLLVNVAVALGTVGFELQFVPVVHSLPGPVQVPSVACADVAASTAMAAVVVSKCARIVPPPAITQTGLHLPHFALHGVKGNFFRAVQRRLESGCGFSAAFCATVLIADNAWRELTLVPLHRCNRRRARKAVYRKRENPLLSPAMHKTWPPATQRAR